MSNSRKYWNSLEQYNETPEFKARANKEFAEELPVEDFLGKEELSESSTTRRDFLKYVGFSVAAATVAACEAPVIKSIPYVVKPEELTPGVANYYASTFFDGNDYAPILVKTREGRPIHIEGNKLSKLSKGGLHPRVNASVLSLYDMNRLGGPTVNGEMKSWKNADQKVVDALNEARLQGGTVRVLSSTKISPSGQKAMEKFTESLGDKVDFKTVTYDAVSHSGIRNANKQTFGKAMIPEYRFDRAKVIVSFGADFLTNWISPIEYAKQYGEKRNPKGAWMNKHYQFEANYSLSGSNADIRGAVKPSEQGAVLIALYNELASKAGKAKLKSAGFDDDNQISRKIKEAASDLWSAKGHGLVISGSNDTDIQVLINGINQMLSSYGSTINTGAEVYLKQGDDTGFVNLVSEMKSGKVDVLFVDGVNPVYSAPGALDFESALQKVKLSVSFADRLDETASLCDINATPNHYLESWNDFHPKTGVYSLTQPTIRPLFNTRQSEESFLRWSGEKVNYYDFIRSNWETGLFAEQAQYSHFDSFWNSLVHDGVYHAKNQKTNEITFNEEAVSKAAAQIPAKGKNVKWEAEFYPETSMGTGSQANNPWLQELPHPVTRITWDNYVAMNPQDMVDEAGNEIYRINIAQEYPAKTAKVTIGDASFELPVIPLPGQRKGTVSIALGYGRTKAGQVVEQGDQTSGDQKTVGVNVFPYVGLNGGTMEYTAEVSIEPTGNEYPIGTPQIHDTMMGRKIVNETSLKTYKNNPKKKWNPDIELADAYGKTKPIEELDLWDAHGLGIGHHWGMNIDLSACIGCGACVVGCHSENNVPVVGKDEIRRGRIMAWLRIDRYFSSDMTKVKGQQDGLGKIDMYAKMEVPSAYPETVFQPVMCQHCNHAPCETVCPVAATTHSNEGMNQMTYNRCIGTRYCANNCPYKVRRFNWFNYMADSKFTDVNPSQSDLGKMVLNPDVTVRARGVMEKCSFCVQRIQDGKLNAKKENRPVIDGEVTTACASACPTNAISFGDMNDEKTVIAEKVKDDRTYNLLAEVGTKPSVHYHTKVRNVNEERVSDMIQATRPGENIKSESEEA